MQSRYMTVTSRPEIHLSSPYATLLFTHILIRFAFRLLSNNCIATPVSIFSLFGKLAMTFARRVGFLVRIISVARVLEKPLS